MVRCARTNRSAGGPSSPTASPTTSPSSPPRRIYYPARFRTGPGGTLDLDDPAFWAWLKQDYPYPPLRGQWEWAKDADQAMRYRELITRGWPRYGGVAFPGG